MFRFGFDPGCGPILIGLSWHDAGVFNGKDGCPNAAMRMAGGDEYAFGVHAGGQKIPFGISSGSLERGLRTSTSMAMFY